LTWGWLTGEILRRATGREIPEIIATDLAAPLGIELWIGSPPEVEGRLNPVTEPPMPPPDEVDRVVELFTPGSNSGRAFTLSGALVDPHLDGRDEVTGVESTVGLGMLLSCDLQPMMGPGSFGHHGSTGSVAFGHRPSGTAFAYVTGTSNTFIPGPEARQLHLIDAVRVALN
jgi:CubicO group peptidase (beta-lactamase class C family)